MYGLTKESMLHDFIARVLVYVLTLRFQGLDSKPASQSSRRIGLNLKAHRQTPPSRARALSTALLYINHQPRETKHCCAPCGSCAF